MLSSGNLKKDYARFAAPTMLAMLVYALYGMVDGIVVGRFLGPDALAAVNFGAPLLSVFFALAALVGVGAGTIVAARLGAGDTAAARRVFTQAIVSAGVFGLALSLFLALCPTLVCRWLGASEESFDYTRDYVRGLGPFALFFILEYSLEALIKADGRPRLAAAAVIGGCCFNAVGDWLFVAKLGWGVWGAGAASGMSQVIAAGVFLWYFLFSRKRTLGFVPIRYSFSLLLRQLRLGVTDAISELCLGVVTWFYNRTVLYYLGTPGVSALTVVTYVYTVVNYTLLGAGQGMQPLVSYHRGANRPENCRRLLKYAWLAQAIVALCITAAAQVMPEGIASLFLKADNAELRALAAGALRRYSLCYLLTGFNLVAACYMTAWEKPGRALTISLGRGFFMQVLMLGLMTALFGENGIWWAVTAAEAVMAVVSLLVLRGAEKSIIAAK